MSSEVFDNWADRMLDGARMPSEVVRCALRRHLDEGVRRAAEHRFRNIRDIELREGVPALIELLRDETGVCPVEPDWHYPDGAGPWSAHPGTRPDSGRPLRPARHDLTSDEIHATFTRAGGDTIGPSFRRIWAFRCADGDGGPATPALSACRLLASATDMRAVPLLVAVFAAPEIRWTVRREAGRALGVFTPPWLDDATPACLAMIATPSGCSHDLRVLWQAIRLIGKIGMPLAEPAVPALVEMLESSRALVLPPLAALALGDIGTPAARLALERVEREFVPGSASWRKRDSVDHGLIRRAVRAGLGLEAVPEIPGPDDGEFRGFMWRRREDASG
jgi:hypothetical protein